MNTQQESRQIDWEAFWMLVLFLTFEVAQIPIMQSVKGPSVIVMWIVFFIGSAVCGLGIGLAAREFFRSLRSGEKKTTATNNVWLNLAHSRR